MSHYIAISIYRKYPIIGCLKPIITIFQYML